MPVLLKASVFPMLQRIQEVRGNLTGGLPVRASEKDGDFYYITFFRVISLTKNKVTRYGQNDFRQYRVCS
jgi:hypothetical protein